MTGSSLWKRGLAVALPAALAISLVATGSAGATAPAPGAPVTEAGVSAQTIGTDTIVGIGDSYMSGEGVMIANHNFSGDKPDSTKDSNWLLANGTMGNLGSDPMQLVNGQIVYKNQANAKMWGSVFGDANGWPEVANGSPQGIESLLYCDRSFAAAPIIGDGWATKNFACSGATSKNQGGKSLRETTGCTFGIIGCKEYFYAKPGVNDETFTVDAPTQTPVVKGQTAMLKEYAETNPDIKVVALSIGGNDFGFGEIGKDCIIAGLAGPGCQASAATQKKVQEGLERTPGAVKSSIENVAEAMAEAGYAPGSWKLVYQNPPLPVSDGADTKGTAQDRLAYGCGLKDATFDWIVGSGEYDDETGLYPQLIDAMQKGIKQARPALGATQLVQIDTTRTFNGHRLCEKGTEGATKYTQPKAGRTPPWQDDNGRKTEWVTYVDLVTAGLTGNRYQKSMPLHPNYWGQRALAGCMSDAAKVDNGSIVLDCRQKDDDLDAAGRPNMAVSKSGTLWITAVGRPSIQGKPNVGQTLTADEGDTFAPAEDYDYDYQWFSDGTPIGGATSRTYVPGAGQLGKTITVKVTASKGSLTPVSATSLGVEVSDLVVDTRPSVTGTPKVGSTLTAQPGSYTPAPDDVAYEWLADGVKIPGATGVTFTPGPDQLGQRISVRVTVTKSGYEQLVVDSDDTAPVAAGGLTVSGRPTITGEAKPGKTLTASSAGVTFSQTPDRTTYRWFRDGDLIEGEQGSTYEVTGDDVGKRITVAVAGDADGYGQAVSQRSTSVGPVSRGAITVLKKPAIRYVNSAEAMSVIKKRKAQYGKDLEIDLVNVFSEFPDPAKITWYRKTGKGVQRLKGSEGADYTPTLADIGSRIRAVIETRNPGWSQATATTAWYRVVKGKYQTVKAPKIRGTAKVGQRLASTKARFLPAGADVRYEWYANGQRIKGATGRVYRATVSDQGKKLRVKAVIRETRGYEGAAVWSQRVGPVKAVRGRG